MRFVIHNYYFSYISLTHILKNKRTNYSFLDIVPTKIGDLELGVHCVIKDAGPLVRKSVGDGEKRSGFFSLRSI